MDFVTLLYRILFGAILLWASCVILVRPHCTELVFIHNEDDPICNWTHRTNITCLPTFQLMQFLNDSNRRQNNSFLCVIDYSQSDCYESCAWSLMNPVAIYLKMSIPTCFCSGPLYPMTSGLIQAAMGVFQDFSSSHEIIFLLYNNPEIRIDLESLWSSTYLDSDHMISARMYKRQNISVHLNSNANYIFIGDCTSLKNGLSEINERALGIKGILILVHLETAACHLESNSSFIYVFIEEKHHMKNILANMDLFKGEINDDMFVSLFLPLISVHFYNHSSNLTTKIGIWTSNTGFERQSNLYSKASRKFLKIVTKHEPPFVIRNELKNGSAVYTGYTIDILNIVAKKLHFDYTLYEVPDGQYGILLPNNTWTGEIGEVAYGKADLAAGPISVTTERDTVIDFTVPYYDYAGLQLLVKGEQRTKQLFVFMNVFANDTWCLWFVVLLVTAMIVYVFHKVRDKMLQINFDDGMKDIMTFSLRDSAWFAVSSVPLAGSDKIPNIPSVRLFVSGFWFFCLIIMASYTANLAAFLTSSRLEAPVKNMNELVGNTGFQYSVQAGSVSQKYFSRMAKIEENFYLLWKEMSYMSENDPDINRFSIWDYPLGDTYMNLWDNMNKAGFVKTSGEGVEKTLKGNFAFFHETPMIKYEMSQRCGLMTVGPMFSTKPYAFVMPQVKTPLLEQFAFEILHLQSGTLLKELKQKWWDSNSIDCNDGLDTTSLSMSTLGGVFIVVSSGCCLGVVILLLERLKAQQKSICRKLPAVYSKTESTTTLSEYDIDNTVTQGSLNTQHIMSAL